MTVPGKKIKVCHLTSVHPTFDIRIFHKECISLADAGYEVFLVAPANDFTFRDGVHIVPVNLPKSRFRRMWTGTFRMRRKALSVHANIYHFHDPELMLCGVLLRLSGKKVVFDIHENVRLSLQSKDWIPHWARRGAEAAYYIIEQICILFYHQLILAEDSYKNYYPKQKSTVILNYPLLVPPVEIKKEMGSPVRFIYSGIVHPLRGIWEMIHLIEKINRSGIEATLDLVGEVRPQTLKQELHQFLQNRNLTQKVIIHGKVEFEKVSQFLTQADFGIALLKPIPNYMESLPTKFFEYMQHGLPVITNNYPLYQTYVEDTKTGICVGINNLESASKDIIALINNRSLFIEMAENGVHLTQTRFTWKSQEHKLLELYKDLV